jgi:tight adherence protein C
MTPLTVIFGLGIFVVLGLVFLFFLSQTSAQSVMLEEVTRRSSAGGDAGSESASSARYFEWVAKPFSFLRGLFSHQPDPDIARRLARAGYRKPEHADIFVGARLAVPAVLGILVALVVRENALFFFFIAVVVGFFAPDFWLAESTKRRAARISESLPDSLDLISICMEAGLGLDQAIVRVGRELRTTHPDISVELLQINFEQRAGVPRIDSWRAFAERIDIDSLQSFVAMLVQTERFGTPIAVALANFSETLRTERRQKAEEIGAKAAVKMVFPLVFFIFPMVFIVTVGPAIIGLLKNLGTLLQ